MAELRDDEAETWDDDLRCPECGAVMSPDDVVCANCGAEFEFVCPQCGEVVPADATVCPNCGAEIGEGVEDEAGEPPSEEGTAEAVPPARATRRDVPRAEFCSNCGEPIGPEDEECPTCGVDVCPDCGAALGSDDAVCANCGAEFVFSCPNCEQDVPVSADVCPYCGFEFEEIDLDEEDEDE